MKRISNDKAFSQLRSVLEQEGIRPALVFLNGLTRHRYTSVFLFEDQTGRHAYFYDRDNPGQEKAPDILLYNSYCIYVKRLETSFLVCDSLQDSKVEPDHPKKDTIRSYCGVPLVDDNRNVFGSACHYDRKPVETDARDVELLEMFGRAIANYL